MKIDIRKSKLKALASLSEEEFLDFIKNKEDEYIEIIGNEVSIVFFFFLKKKKKKNFFYFITIFFFFVLFCFIK